MTDIDKSICGVCAIAVMAKASVEGRAKTRLTPPLSRAEASQINTAFLRDIAQNLMKARLSAAVSPWMAYAPAGSADFFKTHLPADIGLLETVAPNLGECLFLALRSLLDKGYRSVCLLNSDSPTLPTSYLVTAATALSADGDRMVIGPSTDGGYYLIGLKQAHRRLFEDITWSTEQVFNQTMERAREIGLEVLVLPTWYDVDDATSLRTLIGEVLDEVPFRVVGTTVTACDHTREVLEALMAEGLSWDRDERDMAASRVA